MPFLLANSAISTVYNHKLPYWDGAYLLRQFPRSLQTTVVEPWCHPVFCDITKLLLCIYLLCLLKPKFSWQWVSTRLVSCSKTGIYLQYFAVQWLWEGCHQPKLMHPALRSLGLRSPSTRPKGIKWYQIKRSFTPFISDRVAKITTATSSEKNMWWPCSAFSKHTPPNINMLQCALMLLWQNSAI